MRPPSFMREHTASDWRRLARTRTSYSPEPETKARPVMGTQCHAPASVVRVHRHKRLPAAFSHA